MIKVKKPLISIIMNCHNGEEYLEEAINSVFEQTYEKWEIIPCINGVGKWELSYEGECTHETFDTKFEAEKSIHEYVINEFEEQAQ